MPRRGPAPHPRPGNWPGPRGLPQYPDPVTEPIPVLRPPQGPRSRRKVQLAILGAVAALALVGGAAAAASGMGFGNVGAPASACDIPLSVMNEAFDGTSFQVVGDWADQAGSRIPRGIRCDYGQFPSVRNEDAVRGVNVLRQEPPDPMYLAMLPAAAQFAGVRTERTSIPILTTDGTAENSTESRIICTNDGVLWMVIVHEDFTGISFEGLDTVAEAIGCEPQP